MSRDPVFIAHASNDDDFVKQLREALESYGISVWVDSRNLRGGAKLAPEIDDAIERARQVIVVLSPNTVNSPWVRKEIQKALEVEKQRKDEGYRVIPLLLPGIEPSALPLWFDEEPVGVRIQLTTGAMSEALPQVLAALGERLPTDPQLSQTVAPHAVEEMVLKLSDPRIHTADGKRRAVATATLVYEPADKSAREVESKRFSFTAPLGPIEADDLRWYLESYYLWPTGVFKERAERIEAQLPRWGHELYEAALATQSARDVLNAWQNAIDEAEACFSIFVDRELPEGTISEDQAAANEAASQLLSLPWELLHDGRGYLFQGRSRELLALERLLHDQPYAVVRGQGGAGKTTLAVELARWLVRVRRFKRAAFVSLEHYSDARSMLDSLGRQLLPEGDSWSVAQYADLKQALQPVERALADRATIIVLDNLESVLPDQTGQIPAGVAPVDELFALCKLLLDADRATRLLFTSRESLPAPFNHKHRERTLGPLSLADAKKLVAHVMAEEGLIPNPDDPGDKEQDIDDLVEAVNRHARALVLLAREISRRGVHATTENLKQLMAEMDRQHPGDRENSLYASIELSLRRLPPETREQIRVLGVFHGGGQLDVLRLVLGVDEEAVTDLAKQLIEVGLAEAMPYGHLRLDPALPPYLLKEISNAEQEETRSRWAETMIELTEYLYEQWFKDARLAARLTVLELPNLMALLMWLKKSAMPEQTVSVASQIELLLTRLDHPRALAEAVTLREEAVQALKDWSRPQFDSEKHALNRLIEQGNLNSAYEVAQRLLKRSLGAGEEAYQGASYDIASAHFFLGTVLTNLGAVEIALRSILEAERRFKDLASKGRASAQSMIAVVLTESGECLRELGRLDEAETAFKEAIRIASSLNNQRDIFNAKEGLGTLLVLQRRYAEALKAFTEVREYYETIGDVFSIGITWHNIGMAHNDAGQFDQAEFAYRQSLSISVQRRDFLGEAATLSELGSLYLIIQRLEEAVTFYRQAAEIYTGLHSASKEGETRSNLAVPLIKLQRYSEARRELYRAIECKKLYGHATAP